MPTNSPLNPPSQPGAAPADLEPTADQSISPDHGVGSAIVAGVAAGKKRVLIIDDVSGVRKVLRAHLCPPVSPQVLMQQLISKGTLDVSPRYLVDEADQGVRGVEMVREAQGFGYAFDVIFLDMLMPPGIDGIETMRRIRALDDQVHIIVCTALNAANNAELKEANGGTEPLLVRKPPTPDSKLAELVDSLPWRNK